MNPHARNARCSPPVATHCNWRLLWALAVVTIATDAAFASSSLPPPVQVSGFLMDRLSLTSTGSDGGASDAVNFPERRTVKEMLDAVVISAGFVLYLRDPSSPILLSASGSERALAFLRALPPERDNVFTRVWIVQNGTGANAFHDVITVFDDLGLAGKHVFLRGILTDRRAVDAIVAPSSRANMITNPELHLPCMSVACISSGFTVLIPPGTASGPRSYYGALYNTSFAGDALILQTLFALPAHRSNLTAVVEAIVDTNGRLSSVLDISVVGVPPRGLSAAEVTAALRETLREYPFPEEEYFNEWAAPAGPPGVFLCQPVVGAVTDDGDIISNATDSSSSSNSSSFNDTNATHSSGEQYACNFTGLWPPINADLSWGSLPLNVTSLAASQQWLLGTVALSVLPPHLRELEVRSNSLAGVFFDNPVGGVVGVPPRRLVLSNNSFSGPVQLTRLDPLTDLIDISGNNFVGGTVDLAALPQTASLVIDYLGAPRLNTVPTIRYQCGSTHGEVQYRILTASDTSHDEGAHFYSHHSFSLLVAGSAVPAHCEGCTPGATYNAALSTCTHLEGLTFPPLAPTTAPAAASPPEGPGNSTFSVRSLTGSSYCDAACGVAVALLMLFVVFTVFFALCVKKCCQTRRADKKPLMSPANVRASSPTALSGRGVGGGDGGVAAGGRGSFAHSSAPGATSGAAVEVLPEAHDDDLAASRSVVWRGEPALSMCEQEQQQQHYAPSWLGGGGGGARAGGTAPAREEEPLQPRERRTSPFGSDRGGEGSEMADLRRYDAAVRRASNASADHLRPPTNHL